MNTFSTLCPRLMISGLSGGSGKTLITLGLLRALTRRGVIVQPYKKGPDYIDTAWLAGAAKSLAFNLDPYFLSDHKLVELVQAYTELYHPDMLMIEGNRGLYDGKDVAGTCSTARLARLLKAPVVVVLPCTKMTRTMTAVVHGLLTFEPCGLSGVVLNQVGSERHGRLVQASIEEYTDVPVLGIMPRLDDDILPERRMGLFAPHDLDADAIFENLADLVETHLDVARFQDIAKNIQMPPKDASSAEELTSNAHEGTQHACPSLWPEAVILEIPPVIGVVRDKALWFYYEENLEALRRAGAHIVELDLFDSQAWPHLDGLYLGGGFPEHIPAELSDAPHLPTIRTLSDEGLPIYAECGGFLLLCHSIEADGRDYPMAGVFPLRAELCKKPQALGYVDVNVRRNTPFFREGTSFRGHVFHYTKCTPLASLNNEDFIFEFQNDPEHNLAHNLAMPYEQAIPREFDGFLHNNTFGSYAYVYALAVPTWAISFVTTCSNRKRD